MWSSPFHPGSLYAVNTTGACSYSPARQRVTFPLRRVSIRALNENTIHPWPEYYYKGITTKNGDIIPRPQREIFGLREIRYNDFLSEWRGFGVGGKRIPV